MTGRMHWIALAALFAATGACTDDDSNPIGDADGGLDGDGALDSDADADLDSDPDLDLDAADVDADDGGTDGGCDAPAALPTTPFRGQVRVTGQGGATPRVDATAQFFPGEAVVWHEEVMSAGDCRLLRYDAGACTDCWGGVCRDGECIPLPTMQSAGTVTVTGIGSGTVTLEDYGSGYYGYTGGATLTGGAPVGASATGGEFPAFSIDGLQPAPLAASFPDDELDLVNGTDNVVTWTPADYCGSRIRLTLKAPTAAHGLPPRTMIECDAPDTGSLTIPQALIEAFPEMERMEICVLIDCPMSEMARYTRSINESGAPEADLVVESAVRFYLVHPAP